MNRHILQFGWPPVFVALTALLGYMVLAADTQCVPAKILTATNSCAGTYYAYARMTNSAGGIWIEPPTNVIVSSGTFRDASGFPPPYSSCAVVQAFGSPMYFCQSNHLTFPATNAVAYQLMIIVTSPPPPPTNNQPLTLKIQWQ